MVSVSWTDCVWFHPMHYSWQTLMLGWFRWALGTGSDYLKLFFFLMKYTFWSGEHWEQIKHEEKSVVLKSRTKMMGKRLGGFTFTVTPEELCHVSSNPSVVGRAGWRLGWNTCKLKAFIFRWKPLAETSVQATMMYPGSTLHPLHSASRCGIYLLDKSMLYRCDAENKKHDSL